MAAPPLRFTHLMMPGNCPDASGIFVTLNRWLLLFQEGIVSSMKNQHSLVKTENEKLLAKKPKTKLGFYRSRSSTRLAVLLSEINVLTNLPRTAPRMAAAFSSPEVTQITSSLRCRCSRLIPIQQLFHVQSISMPLRLKKRAQMEPTAPLLRSSSSICEFM